MTELLRRRGFEIGAAALAAAVLALAAMTANAASSSDSPAASAESGGNAGSGRSAQCFFRRSWTGGWKVTPDARAIYIRVSGSIYRLDLQSSYSLLKDPFAILSNRDSSNTICGPLDLRLTVSNQAGIEQWPIVKRLTRLTPVEAAALPKKLRP